MERPTRRATPGAVIAGALAVAALGCQAALPHSRTEAPQITPEEALHARGRVESIAVAAGGACAVRDGQLVCWGAPEGLPLVGDTWRVPPTLIPLPGRAAEVILGAPHAGDEPHGCARSTAGEVHCWGGTRYGQQGDFTPSPPRAPWSPAPVRMALPEAAVALSTTGYRTCALLSSGRVSCWGRRAPLDGTLPPPTLVLREDGAPLERIEQLGGEEGIDDEGHLWAWGDDRFGRVTRTIEQGALADHPRVTTPARRVPDTPRVRSVGAGEVRTCVVTTEGALACWGLLVDDPFGRPAWEHVRADAVVYAGLGLPPLARVRCSRQDCVAISVDGSSAYALAFREAPPTPTALAELAGLGVLDVASDDHGLCARLEDGTLRCGGAYVPWADETGPDEVREVDVTPAPGRRGLAPGDAVPAGERQTPHWGEPPVE